MPEPNPLTVALPPLPCSSSVVTPPLLPPFRVIYVPKLEFPPDFGVTAVLP